MHSLISTRPKSYTQPSQPTGVFVRHAVSRLESIANDLRRIQRVEPRMSTEGIESRLTVLAGDTHFFGLMRSHRYIREARQLLWDRAKASRHDTENQSQISTSIDRVVSAKKEVQIERDEVGSEGGR